MFEQADSLPREVNAASLAKVIFSSKNFPTILIISNLRIINIIKNNKLNINDETKFLNLIIL